MILCNLDQMTTIKPDGRDTMQCGGTSGVIMEPAKVE